MNEGILYMKYENILNHMKSMKLFNGLSEGEIKRVYEEVQPSVQFFEKGKELVHQKEISDVFGMVIKGCIHGKQYNTDGTLHIVSVYTEGELVNLEAAVSKSRVAPVSLEASEDSLLILFSDDMMRRSTYSPQVAQNLVEILADDNIKKAYKIEILTTTGLRNKVLKYLSILSSKADGPVVTVRMNQSQLAEYLFVSRSNLSKELNDMKREGIIDIQGNRYTLLERRQEDL